MTNQALQIHQMTLASGPVCVLRAGRPDAPPVVLLHGGGVDRALLSWRLLIPVLAPRFSVFAPDWPGYGKTPPHEGTGYGVSDITDWLLRLLDAANIEKAHVAGVSMGGAAALSLALKAPDRVDKLIPVDAYGLAPRWWVHPLAYAALQTPFHATTGMLMRSSPWAARQLFGTMFVDRTMLTPELGAEAQAAAKASGGMAAFHRFLRTEMEPTRFATDFAPHFHEIHHETLIIHGEMDNLVPVKYAKAAAQKMPNAQLLLMPTGHVPMREQPEAFNAAVTEFLS